MTILNDLMKDGSTGEEADDETKTDGEEGEPPKKKKKKCVEKENAVTSNAVTKRKRKPLKEIQVGLHKILTLNYVAIALNFILSR